MPDLPALLKSWANSPDDRCRRSEDGLCITVQACGRRVQALVVPVGAEDKDDWQVVTCNLPAVLWTLRETRTEADEEMQGNVEAIKEWLHAHLLELAQSEE